MTNIKFPKTDLVMCVCVLLAFIQHGAYQQRPVG